MFVDNSVSCNISNFARRNAIRPFKHPDNRHIQQSQRWRLNEIKQHSAHAPSSERKTCAIVVVPASAAEAERFMASLHSSLEHQLTDNCSIASAQAITPPGCHFFLVVTKAPALPRLLNLRTLTTNFTTDTRQQQHQ